MCQSADDQEMLSAQDSFTDWGTGPTTAPIYSCSDIIILSSDWSRSNLLTNCNGKLDKLLGHIGELILIMPLLETAHAVGSLKMALSDNGKCLKSCDELC